MRLNEILGIEQSRAWGVCSLNDFRRVSVQIVGRDLLTRVEFISSSI